MKIPSDLGHLLYILREAEPDSTTLLVGGCVRDYMLGRTPKDFDVVTDISMDRIGEIVKVYNGSASNYDRLVDNHVDLEINSIGKQFLVLDIKTKKGSYEIANFRKDGVYLDGRRPDAVEIGTIQEDATRRDFTINALYYCPRTEEIIAPLKTSLSDLAQKRLKFIGKAEDRIKEDYLRVFRFYRFLQEKDLIADKKSLKACRTHFEDAVKNSAGERIRNEIERMVKL